MADAANNNDRKKYVLRVRCGDELSLHRPEEICNEESIMRPSYEKAMRALMRIMRQTKRFHEENEHGDADIYALENRLFGYSGNVIAFAASRGGGKTATMLSFSKILHEGFGKHKVDNSFLNDMTHEKEGVSKDHPADWMARCSFIPLTPIAPAVLEGDQNILYVVLSRLYRYAERLLSERSRGDRVREVQKNELIRSFQNVLSGINGIKHPEKKHPGDLAGMQDVCDGLSLSRHFYHLIQNILKLAIENQNICDKYLVIQLDDTDSKMQNIYAVLEDVRKYLMIPNLVILMSVDQNCMSDVVFQDNLRCFPDLIKVDADRLSRDLSRITNKYIDKLIPPTHMVQLPQLDQVVIQWGDMLRLKYVDEKDNNIYEWMDCENLDLQTAILMLIYHKTGILFVKPTHYMHNIVPRTLRGLVQLLSLLDSMKDLTELEFGKGAEGYAESVLNQVEIAAINQRRFANYFKKSWLSVKITNLEDLDFLRKFADTVSANRIRLAVKYLCKRYELSLTKAVDGREDLDQLMWEIDQIHRTEADFLLMFAIRTLFTLDSHQHILKRKREDVKKFLAEKKERFLTFNLCADYIYVPDVLWTRTNKAAKEPPVSDSEAKEYQVALTPLLDISNSKIESLCSHFNDHMDFQQLLHRTQEIAVTFSANCDAAYAAGNYWKDYIKQVEPRAQWADIQLVAVQNDDVHRLLMALLKQLSEFNDGELQKYTMEYLADLDDIMNERRDSSLTSIIFELVRKKDHKDDSTSLPGSVKDAADERNSQQPIPQMDTPQGESSRKSVSDDENSSLKDMSV